MQPVMHIARSHETRLKQVILGVSSFKMFQANTFSFHPISFFVSDGPGFISGPVSLEALHWLGSVLSVTTIFRAVRRRFPEIGVFASLTHTHTNSHVCGFSPARLQCL